MIIHPYVRISTPTSRGEITRIISSPLVALDARARW
jgi:hypothetical protein